MTALFIGIATGCSDYVAQPVVPRPPARVMLTPSVIALAPGTSRMFNAVVLDDRGDTLQVPITWRSTVEIVASVSADGLVVGGSSGVASIIAAAPNGVADTAAVSVPLVEPPHFNVTPMLITISVGDTVPLQICCGPTHLPVTWTMSTNGVVEISSEHVVKGIGKGSVTAIAKAATGKAASITVHVN